MPRAAMSHRARQFEYPTIPRQGYGNITQLEMPKTLTGDNAFIRANHQSRSSNQRVARSDPVTVSDHSDRQTLNGQLLLA